MFFSSSTSFLREKGKTITKRYSFLLLAALVIGVSAGLFTGCDSNTNEDGTIEGTWVSSPDEEYIITATTFTATGFFTGTIENIRKDGSGAGYIVIRFTENTVKYIKNGSPFDPVGRYYVIHYKNLTSSTVQLSQANSARDPDDIVADWGEYGLFSAGGAAGKATRTEAESTYTVAKGYFSFYSACTQK